MTKVESKTEPLRVYYEEINEVIKEYHLLKTPTCEHPSSIFINYLSKLYNNWTNNKTANNYLEYEELYTLVQELKSLIKNQEYSRHSFNACRKLRIKLRNLLECFGNVELFHLAVYRQDRYDDIKKALSNLVYHNQLLYHHYNEIQKTAPREAPIPTVGGPYAVYRPSMFDTETTYYETTDISKNQTYKAKLDSHENMSFIYKNPDHAILIAEIFTLLHYGKIGKNAQEVAEYYIWEGKNNELEDFLFLKNAFVILKNNDLLNASHADLVVQICQSRDKNLLKDLSNKDTTTCDDPPCPPPAYNAYKL